MPIAFGLLLRLNGPAAGEKCVKFTHLCVKFTPLRLCKKSRHVAQRPEFTRPRHI